MNRHAPARALPLTGRAPSWRWLAFAVLCAAVAMPAAAQASDRAFLGITSHGLSGEEARDRGLSSRDGSLVDRVYSGTAAERAGLLRGDVIAEFDGEKVLDDGELTRGIRAHKPGDRVSLVVVRDGKRVTLTAELGSYSDRRSDEEDHPGWAGILEGLFGSRSDGPLLGVSVMDLNPQLAAFFGVAEEGGVLLTEVDLRSAAERAGLRAGDVVVSVNGSRVRRPGDIHREIAGRFGETLTVTVVRAGARKEIPVALEED